MSARVVAKARGAAIAAFFLLIAGAWAGAQETGGIDTNVDSLFGGDEVVSEAPAQNPADAAKQNPVTAALKSDKVRVGGSFYGSIAPTATWADFWDGDLALSDETTSLGTSLKSTIFFDARPTEDFRVYGSAKAAYPFSTTTGGVSVPNLSVFELFADFNLNDKVYFRMGKSTVKWGVGYFWSPADVINLEPINVLDAEAQREGPINFRVNVPIAGTQNNLYFYTILDPDYADIDFDTTALAAKAEFLLGNYEVGLGAYYRYDTAERAMLTLTGPLGDFDVFGEAMLSRGSAKTYVTGIATDGTISYRASDDVRESLFFSASAGFLYSNSNENLTVVGQYYYNGEGYAPTDKETLVDDAYIAVALNPASSAQLLAALSSLISGSGQHYGALMLSKGELFALEDLSASVIAVANLSDLSGLVKPSVSWSVVDNFKLTLSPMFFFGPAGSGEFSMAGDLVYLSLGAVVSASF